MWFKDAIPSDRAVRASHDNDEEDEDVRLLQGRILEVENLSISM